MKHTNETAAWTREIGIKSVKTPSRKMAPPSQLEYALNSLAATFCVLVTTLIMRAFDVLPSAALFIIIISPLTVTVFNAVTYNATAYQRRNIELPLFVPRIFLYPVGAAMLGSGLSFVLGSYGGMPAAIALVTGTALCIVGLPGLDLHYSNKFLAICVLSQIAATMLFFLGPWF